MSHHDTTRTQEIICPHCGHEFSESYEYADDDGHTMQCNDCEKDFVLEVHRSIKFSTSKVDCERQKPPKLHQWNEELTHNVTTPEDVERYKRENSCLRDTKVGQFWIRTCDACGSEDFSKKVPMDGKPVWDNEPGADAVVEVP